LKSKSTGIDDRGTSPVVECRDRGCSTATTIIDRETTLIRRLQFYVSAFFALKCSHSISIRSTEDMKVFIGLEIVSGGGMNARKARLDIFVIILVGLGHDSKAMRDRIDQGGAAHCPILRHEGDFGVSGVDCS
jgi:hypothetical protein